MQVRRAVATVVGVAASVAVGVGIYGLMRAGDCDATGACAVPSGVALIALNVGIPVATIAIIAGGRLPVMGSLFFAVGAGAVAVDTSFGWTFGGAFVLVGCALFAVAAYLHRRVSPGAQMGASMVAALAGGQNRLVGPGEPAVGTVLTVADTGTTVNDDPLARLRLRVEPADGSAPFEAEAVTLVSRLAPPRPGDRFAVVYDPADRTRLAVREALPAEPAAGGLVDQLEKLDRLRRSGSLTESEFELAKARLLGTGDPEP